MPNNTNSEGTGKSLKDEKDVTLNNSDEKAASASKPSDKSPFDYFNDNIDDQPTREENSFTQHLKDYVDDNHYN